MNLKHGNFVKVRSIHEKDLLKSIGMVLGLASAMPVGTEVILKVIAFWEGWLVTGITEQGEKYQFNSNSCLVRKVESFKGELVLKKTRRSAVTQYARAGGKQHYGN